MISSASSGSGEISLEFILDEVDQLAVAGGYLGEGE